MIQPSSDFRDASGNQPVETPEADLTIFYTSPTDPVFASDMATYAAQTQDFARRYQNRLDKLTPPELAECIGERDRMYGLESKIANYASLLKHKNINKYDAFAKDTFKRLTDIDNGVIFYDLELAKLPRAELQAGMAACPALKRYETYIDGVTKSQPHLLSEPEEKILSTMDLSGRSGWVGLFDKLMPSIRFPYRGQLLPENDLLDIMSHSADRQERAEAYEGLKTGLKQNELVLTYITNVLALDKEQKDGLRHYPTPVAARNLSNNISDDIVAALDKAVTDAYPRVSHRFYELKRQMLGVEKLKPYDRNASVGASGEERLTFEEAKTNVLAAYRQFSPEMAAIAQRAFDENWIDARPGEGKDTGAFSASTAVALHPFIYMNFLGNRRDESTLAHELGHTIHQYLAAQGTQSDILADTPLTLAETASIFGEKLTFKKRLAAETDPGKRKVMLAEKIDDMINSVVRQIAFFNFEKDLHTTRREKGELSTEQINGIYFKTQQDALGPAFDLDEGYGQLWSYVPHFIHTPFYVYAYAFGDCLVNSLDRKYEEAVDKEDFKTKYLALLSAGGSLPQEDAFKPFGLDLNDPSFWDAGMKEIENLIDQLEVEMKNEAALRPAKIPPPTSPA